MWPLSHDRLSSLLELTAQWDEILTVGTVSFLPVLLNSLLNGTRFLLLVLCILSLILTFVRLRVWMLVNFTVLYLIFIIVLVISSMLLWSTVGLMLFGDGGIGFAKILWFIHISGFVLIWFPLLPSFSVSLILRLVVLGVLADPARIDEEVRKAWLPHFCRSGQRKASLEEFDEEVEGWLPLLPEVSLPRLTGQVLADVVQRKGATAGSLDGWGWRELKVLPVAWFDGLASVLSRVEEIGVWRDGLLDAYIAMIPKSDGDATTLGQRPLCVLPVVYRIWASARMGQLDGWFQSWVPESVFSAGGGRSSVEAWYTSALDIEEVLSGATDSDVHLFVPDVIKSFDTVDRGVLDRVLSSLGLPGWFRHAYFEHHAHVRLRFKLASGLGAPWTRDGGIPQGAL